MKTTCLFFLCLIFGCSFQGIKTTNFAETSGQDDFCEPLPTERVRRLNKANNVVNAGTATVTFDCNGGLFGSAERSFQSVVPLNSLVEKPDSSQLHRPNCTFLAWTTVSGNVWSFDQNTVSEDVLLRAEWIWDSSMRIENWNSNERSSAENYFLDKYYLSTGWRIIQTNSLKNTVGHLPLEIGGNNTGNPCFPSSDLSTAIETSGIKSSYGGCGPIAMIGVLDFLSRYKDYSSIMNNPLDSGDRTQLAYDVFTNTPTIEWVALKAAQAKANSDGTKSLSSGDGITITFPDNFVDGFATLTRQNYHLNEQLSVTNQGHFLTPLDSQINRIKQSIDHGLPVTIYAGEAGSGVFGNHYVNAYAYETWSGVDRDGKVISNTIVNTRVNWGWGQTYDCHMDTDLLNSIFSGIIYYTERNENQAIRPFDFSTAFVNSYGQGQYFFANKESTIVAKNNFAFATTRLRCGYIEGQYLVLSANRTGAGEAFLEMNFSILIKALNFDISLWSDLEGLRNQGDSVTLKFKNESNEWGEYISFDPARMSTSKARPDNYYFSFPTPTNGIMFEVHKENPTGSRNKGRVVIGDINLFY